MGVTTLTDGTGFAGTRALPQAEQYMASSLLSALHLEHFLTTGRPSNKGGV